MLNTINSIDLAVLLKLNEFVSGFGFLNKFFAEYLVYSIPLILIILWFWEKKAKKPAMRAFVSAMLAWPILGNIIGTLVDRARPFENGGVQELIFHRPTYSFPSDHAAALFSIAFSFWFSGYKKLGGAVMAMGVVISFFRVATAVHWPTDILGGFAVGLFAAWVIKSSDKILDVVYNFVLKIMTKLRLA